MSAKPRWLERHAVLTPHLTLCMSAAEFSSIARHCKKPAEDAGQWLDTDRCKACVHTWDRDGRLTCVVCIHPDAFGSDPIEVAASLCHEAVHVFQRLCDSIGEDSPSREFEAYGIERIAEQLMREYARRMEKVGGPNP